MLNSNSEIEKLKVIFIWLHKSHSQSCIKARDVPIEIELEK